MPEFEESEGFKLKSGNKTSFKNMGSSPAKQDKTPSHETTHDFGPGKTWPGDGDKLRPQTKKDKKAEKKSIKEWNKIFDSKKKDKADKKQSKKRRKDFDKKSKDPNYTWGKNKPAPTKHIKLDKDNVAVKHEHASTKPPKPRWGEKEEVSPNKQIKSIEARKAEIEAASTATASSESKVKKSPAKIAPAIISAVAPMVMDMMKKKKEKE